MGFCLRCEWRNETTLASAHEIFNCSTKNIGNKTAFMLKSRNHFPPGGFIFRQPQTGWEAPRHLSFDATVKEIIRHRINNPQHKLPVDRATVEAELENFTIARLKARPGWEAYLTDGEPTVPKSLPLRDRAARVVAGAKKYVTNTVAGASLWAKFFGDGEPVSKDVAERRAAICIACPYHLRGNFAQRFNSVVGRELQAIFGKLKEVNMTTAYDESLTVCDICDCPMRAKVWIPIDRIESDLKEETKAKLPKHCWIVLKL